MGTAPEHARKIRPLAAALLLAIVGLGGDCSAPPRCPSGQRCASPYGLVFQIDTSSQFQSSGVLRPIAVGGHALLRFTPSVSGATGTILDPAAAVITNATQSTVDLRGTSVGNSFVRIADGTGTLFGETMVSFREVLSVAVRPVGHLPATSLRGTSDGPLTILRGSVQSFRLTPYSPAAASGAFPSLDGVVDEGQQITFSPTPVAQIEQLDWDTVRVTAREAGAAAFTIRAAGGFTRDIPLNVVDSVDALEAGAFVVPDQRGTIARSGETTSLGATSHLICGVARRAGEEVLVDGFTYVIDGAMRTPDDVWGVGCVMLRYASGSHNVTISTAGLTATFVFEMP